VMRKEEAERIQLAESTRLAACNLRIHRFAIIFEEIQPMCASKVLDDVQRRRIPKDAGCNNHSSPGSQSTLQLADIDVQRVQFDIHEPKLQPILLKRMKRGAPGNGRNDDLIAPLKRPVRFIKETRDRNEIRR